MLLLRSTDSNLWRQARALLTLVSSLRSRRWASAPGSAGRGSLRSLLRVLGRYLGRTTLGGVTHRGRPGPGKGARPEEDEGRGRCGEMHGLWRVRIHLRARKPENSYRPAAGTHPSTAEPGTGALSKSSQFATEYRHTFRIGATGTSSTASGARQRETDFLRGSIDAKNRPHVKFPS